MKTTVNTIKHTFPVEDTQPTIAVALVLSFDVCADWGSGEDA